MADRTCASLKIHRYESATSTLFTVAPEGSLNERKGFGSPYGSHGSDKLEDAAAAADAIAQLKSGRIFPGASQATPPLPPKASNNRMSNSSGNLAAAAAAASGGSSLSGASNYRSMGSMAGSTVASTASGAGGIVRHSIGSTSQSNLQSLYGGNTSGNSLAASAGGDATFDSRRALYYANQPSSSGSHSATSSPALTFLPGSAVPRALVSLVSMQGVTTASQLEQIFRGDDQEYAQAQQQLEAMRSQFEYGQQLKESFGFDEDSFRFLAKQYKLFSSGKVAEGDADDDGKEEELTFVQMCAHNALAAFVTGNARLSQMWRILQVLYETEEAKAPPSPPPIETRDTLGKDASNSQKYYTPPPEPQHQQLHHHAHHLLHSHYIAETKSEDSISVLSMDTDDHSHHNDLGHRKDAKHLDEFAPHGVGGGGANPSQTMMLLEQLDHVNPQAMQGFDPYPYDAAARGTSTRDGIADRGGGPGGVSGARKSNDSPSSSPMIVHGNAVHGELNQLRDAVLKELLEYYADVGDLQTCVAIAVVVSKVANVEKVMGKSWLQQIYMHYIDLLHQLRIYSAANELVSNCSDQSIRQMNMVRARM